MREKHNATETSRRFRTSRLKKTRMRRYAPVRTMHEEKNRRGPLLSALKVLTGAQRRIFTLCVDIEEARNPRWVSHPDLFSFPSFSFPLSPFAPGAPS